MSETAQQHTNFGFLKQHSPLLHTLARQAERYFAEDPNTCLFKLRQFGEKLAQLLCAATRTPMPYENRQVDVIRALQDNGVIGRELADRFHAIRKSGNEAVHNFTGAHNEALTMLKMAHLLGVVYYKYTQDKNFKAGAFIPPPDPRKLAKAVEDQLAKLRAELAAERQAKAEVEALATEEARRRAEAETAALLAQEEKAVFAELAEETEATLKEERKSFEALLEELEEKAAATPPEEIEDLKAETREISLEMDEDSTRALIDQQLREAGWEADTATLRYAQGVRPQKGRNLAIAEWPTESGPADYVLFIGLTPVAVVEAKRANKNVSAALVQAERYSKGIKLSDDLKTPGGPWGEYRIPFLFSTNGTGFLHQIKEFSGVWFQDARVPTNSPRALEGWYTPDGINAYLKKDIAQAEKVLQQEELDYLSLRYYQNEAILSVENALRNGQRSILLAMATGTGKTRTAIGLIYRLLKAKRFNRILFLVDRTSLGDQAHDAFQTVEMEGLQKFADIYEVKSLGDITPDVTTKVHIATVQAMVRRAVLQDTDFDKAATVDQYDCIIVDECHRGYNLDKEMTDAELEFRSEQDYISKYRRVLDHFDAVRIGLTATPALHTNEIFGKPVYNYSIRKAVIDGYLVDHEPPIQIVTALAEDGITWRVGEPMQIYDIKKAQMDLMNAPDEVTIEVEGFNRKVVTESFNQVVCDELARHIDPGLPGKTLIFAATDNHCDMVVRLLKEAMDERYGPIKNNVIRKITGQADKPSQLIRRYKNEKEPSIAVTVDLLTTGIDVPEIVHIVFLRRVRSRILYEQMMGRATRLCNDSKVYPDLEKEVFRIFDAVQLYQDMQDYTEMKPVVTRPQISYEQLVGEILSVEDEDAIPEFIDQLVVKLQQKKLGDTDRKDFEILAGMTVKELAQFFRESSPATVVDWLKKHPRLPEFLDTATGGSGPKVLISHHEDEIRRVERGYGKDNSKPADYLESFAAYVRDNINNIPALTVVTQRPRDLTRAQLRELEQTLAQEGYTDTNLRTAYQETTNEEIAASIIGFIRQQALGCPLMAYEERVDRALKRILGSHQWTGPQRKWLERIAKQMKQEVIVDRAALDQGAFKRDGGFKHLNKRFDGRLEAILGELHEAAWEDDVA